MRGGAERCDRRCVCAGGGAPLTLVSRCAGATAPMTWLKPAYCASTPSGQGTGHRSEAQGGGVEGLARINQEV